MRTALLVLVLILVPLAGCMGEEAQTVDSEDQEPQSGTVEAAQLPESAADVPEDEPHGTPNRTDGPVEVEMGQNGNWVAKQLVVIRNGIGDTKTTSLGAETSNGAIRVLGFDGGGYALEATLSARGETESLARERLAEMQLVHDDSKAGTHLTLDTQVLPGEQVCLLDLLCPSVSQWTGKSATLVYAVPARASYDLELETSNGAIQVQALHGSGVDAASSNGAISIDGSWDDAEADSSNGRITLDGRFGSAVAGTSNGAIDAMGEFDSARLSTSNGAIEATGSFGDLDARTSNGRITLDGTPNGDGSHTWALQSSNGRITATVATGSEYGYDVKGSTSNGRVTIDLPDGQEVGQQTNTNGHVRTSGYDSRSHRTAVDLQTSNSSITLSG